LGRLWAALLGRAQAPSAPPQPPGPIPAPTAEPGLRGQISVLEASLAEAEEKMIRMREEYARLDEEKARSVATAGAAELQRVFKKLAPPLAMLSTLAQKSRNGEDVLAIDLAQTVASVEKALASGGLERIGEAGSKVVYDAALHARMSGGAATEGEPVILHLPGYRLGGVVLHKAMVAVAEKPGQTS
jgi:molecular chaperone GrpE (heat shock protein)